MHVRGTSPEANLALGSSLGHHFDQKQKLDTWKAQTKQAITELATQHQLTPFYDSIELP